MTTMPTTSTARAIAWMLVALELPVADVFALEFTTPLWAAWAGHATMETPNYPSTKTELFPQLPPVDSTPIDNDTGDLP